MSDVDGRDWVVMLSGSPWRAAAHRQQAMARELSVDRRVLFVDPPRNRPRWTFAVHRVTDAIWRVEPPTALPFGRQLPPANTIGRQVTAVLLRRWLDARGGARILWLDEDLAAPLVGRLGESSVIYDATDLDWTFTRRWNRWTLRRMLRHAVGAADLVLASSAALPARLPAGRRPAVVIPNACDPDHFCPDGPSAAFLADLPRPRLGYLGSIDTRAFDGELVAAVARDHPEWTFVLVGPATRAGRRPLRGLANVHVFDPVPYPRAADVVRACDIGIVPYRVGGLIDYVHPKKCYEYLAAGKAVVATALPALVELVAPVRLANGPAAFADAIARALRCAACPLAITLRRGVGTANGWPARGVAVRGVVAELGAR
jgi:glycosyltransferase involved in cell wall biosynthesis